jgi:hypothetical protein
MEHACYLLEFPVIQALALRAKDQCLRVFRGPFPRCQGTLKRRIDSRAGLGYIPSSKSLI